MKVRGLEITYDDWWMRYDESVIFNLVIESLDKSMTISDIDDVPPIIVSNVSEHCCEIGEVGFDPVTRNILQINFTISMNGFGYTKSESIDIEELEEKRIKYKW